MWSCFIWRSDIAYEMEIFMRGAVRVFDGTPYINLIYRLFGVDIGSGVFLFSPTFMEHDLTHIGDAVSLQEAPSNSSVRRSVLQDWACSFEKENACCPRWICLVR